MWTHNTLCLIIPASTLVLSLVEILKSAGLANACSLGPVENSSCRGSAFVQKMTPEATSEHLISKNFLGEHHPKPPMSCHIHTH